MGAAHKIRHEPFMNEAKSSESILQVVVAPERLLIFLKPDSILSAGFTSDGFAVTLQPPAQFSWHILPSSAAICYLGCTNFGGHDRHLSMFGNRNL